MKLLRTAVPLLLVLAASSWGGVIRCANHEEADSVLEAAVRQASGMRGVAARLAAGDPAPRELLTEHFAIYYQVTGPHAVAQASIDVNQNGHPDGMDSLGKLAEQVWRLAMDTLGYRAPVARDSTFAYGVKPPSGKFAIEVIDIGTSIPSIRNGGYLGFASRRYADPKGVGQELLLENDFIYGDSAKHIQVVLDSLNLPPKGGVLYDYALDPLKGWAVAVAHEFYHNLQYVHDQDFRYAWHEMTATWFASRAFPQIRHHWQYYPTFLAKQSTGVFSTWEDQPYANFVFVRGLAHALGPHVVRDLWPYHYSEFTTDESEWFPKGMAALGAEEKAFVQSYVGEMTKLYTGQANALIDAGQRWRYKTDNFTLTDTVGGFGGPQLYGMSFVKLGLNSGNVGLNYALWPKTPTSSACASYMRLPSNSLTVVCPTTAPVIFARNPDDVSIVVGLIQTWDKTKLSSVSLYATRAAPSSSISRRPAPAAPALPTRRLDLLGRPVQDGARGIVFKFNPETGWRRSIDLER